MNLILLTIDCLRADHPSCLGYSKKTTPNLDNLAPSEEELIKAKIRKLKASGKL